MTQTKNNPTGVLVDYEEKMALTKAAEFLETLAIKLKEDGTFVLTQGEKIHEVTPSSTVELQVKLEKKKDKYKLEVELEWKDDVEGIKLSIS